MEFIRGIHNLQSRHYGCVLTVGNFDGFHRGHQALITELQAEGYRLGLPVMVIIFEPQPQEYFAGRAVPARLSLLRDKVQYLTAAGVDALICINFNRQFAALSANDFITDLLVQKLGVRFIVVGSDFKFGAKRQGDYTLLQQLSKIFRFKVTNITTFTEKGYRVSSTAIRKALSKDCLIEAEMMLGHTYRLSGRVIRGSMLGRTIDFPTANVSLKGLRVPINGVYAVEVYGINEYPLPGVANIGVRPTVHGIHQRLEVHLLNVTMDLYNYHIEVVIRAKLRNEQRFASLNDLKRQIISDVTNAYKYFRLNTSSN